MSAVFNNTNNMNQNEVNQIIELTKLKLFLRSKLTENPKIKTELLLPSDSVIQTYGPDREMAQIYSILESFFNEKKK